MDENAAHEWPEYSEDVHQAWNQIAGFWDEQFGEGNAFHMALVGPTVERLLALQPREAVLDVACGNGAFSRRMASLGARVTACDFSEVFLERARARTAEAGLAVDYHRTDATDAGALLALGEGRYDAVVSNMALMDMAEIEPFFAAAARLLRPGGRLVFSILHPCFNTIYLKKVIEEEDREGQLALDYSLRLSGYISPAARRGIGIPGQPAPQIYFHRPLSTFLTAAFQHGFVMDGCAEPVFPEGARGRRPHSWEAFREFPPVFAARLRIP